MAKVYAEKASGRNAERAKLKEMLDDLQVGDTVIAENIDRLSRLPLREAEGLIARIRDKGARLLLPNVLDMPEMDYTNDSMEAVVFSAMQDLLLKILLKSSSDDYELRRERQAAGIRRAMAEGKQCFGRRIDQKRVDNVMACRRQGLSIAQTARVVGCSDSTVKRIWRLVQDGVYHTSVKT